MICEILTGLNWFRKGLNRGFFYVNIDICEVNEAPA
jgi:hypothetical protein